MLVYKENYEVYCPNCNKEMPFDYDYGVFICTSCETMLNEDFVLLDEDFNIVEGE